MIDNRLHYNFYYYTSEGKFLVNPKTFLLMGLTVSSVLIIYSVDTMFINHQYLELGLTSVVFVVIIFFVRWLNK